MGDGRRIQSVSAARAAAAGKRRCSDFMMRGKQTTENNVIISKSLMVSPSPSYLLEKQFSRKKIQKHFSVYCRYLLYNM